MGCHGDVVEDDAFGELPLFFCRVFFSENMNSFIFIVFGDCNVINSSLPVVELSHFAHPARPRLEPALGTQKESAEVLCLFLQLLRVSCMYYCGSVLTMFSSPTPLHFITWLNVVFDGLSVSTSNFLAILKLSVLDDSTVQVPLNLLDCPVLFLHLWRLFRRVSLSSDGVPSSHCWRTLSKACPGCSPSMTLDYMSELEFERCSMSPNRTVCVKTPPCHHSGCQLPLLPHSSPL